MEQLGQEESSKKRVVMLSQDSFYKKLDANQKKLAKKGEYNFDHPGLIPPCLLLQVSYNNKLNFADAFDTKLLSVTLKGILESKTVHVPKYDFKTNSR